MRPSWKVLTLVGAASSVLAASPAQAQEGGFERFGEASSTAQTVVLDNIFIFVCAVLVLLMQPGFALVEAGLTRAKNVSNIMMKNLMDVSIGVMVFGAVGWSIAYPGDFSIGSIFGFAGFGVEGLSSADGGIDLADAAEGGYPLGVPVDFLFQAAFAATAATIVSGAVAGRTKFKGYIVYSILLTGLIYPIVVSWKWGGGWLDELGYVDFAGSGLVHMVGGVAALMGAIFIGPRIGKFGPDGKPRAIPGHSIPFVILGVFILFIGWFGFNPGSQLQADMAVPYLAVLTAFAACSGALAAMVVSWAWLGKPDVSMAGNGMLAGLVAICSGIGNMNSIGTIATGLVAGAIVVVAVIMVERMGVDDPVGAFSVHGVCGAWGLLATGLFATSGSPVDDSVKGLFYGGGVEQLWYQFVGVIAIGAFVTIAAGALFAGMKAAGVLRVSAEDEMEGLDIVEHGSPGYAADVVTGPVSS